MKNSQKNHRNISKSIDEGLAKLNVSARAKTKEDEIDGLFREITFISDFFPKLFNERKSIRDPQEKNNYKKKTRDYIDLIYNKFSRIEIILRAIKEDIQNEFADSLDDKPVMEYSFHDYIELTEAQYKELKTYDLPYRRLYVWIGIYLRKIKELGDYIRYYLENVDQFHPNSIDSLIKDINKLYRQILVVHNVLNNKAFTDGSIERKVKIIGQNFDDI